MEVESFLPLGRGCQLLVFGVCLALSEADALDVGRADDDLALGDGRGDVTGEATSCSRLSCRWRVEPRFSGPRRKEAIREGMNARFAYAHFTFTTRGFTSWHSQRNHEQL
jgi:hypothetical protein